MSQTEVKIERRGGARPNTGPKPQTLSMSQVAKMLRRARKKAKETGKTIDDILLGFIYAESEGIQHRLAAIKLWKEYTVAKLQEGGETDKALGPAVFLPEHHPRLSVVKTDAA